MWSRLIAPFFLKPQLIIDYMKANCTTDSFLNNSYQFLHLGYYTGDDFHRHQNGLLIEICTDNFGAYTKYSRYV